MTSYPQIVQATRALPGFVNLAYRNDLIEMYLTMAASAGLVQMPGLAAAMNAAGRIAAARAQCGQAIMRINNVTLHWLSASANSVELLSENQQRWQQLSARAKEISDDLQRLQTRSRANTWEGVAHETKDDFHADVVRFQETFSTAVSKIPPTLSMSQIVTRALFIHIYAPMRATQAQAFGIAARLPLPRPSGFGLCTRTPTLASLLHGLASNLEGVRHGGSWRSAEQQLSSQLETVNHTMQAERNRDRRSGRGGGRGGHGSRTPRWG